MLLYALLYLTGYPDMTIEEIKNFRQLGSKTPVIRSMAIRRASRRRRARSARGLATAVGMAIAEKLLAARYANDPRRPIAPM